MEHFEELTGRIIAAAMRVHAVLGPGMLERASAVAVEVKAVSKLHPVHKAQLLSQLRVADLRVGLLLNFQEQSLKNGLARVANGR